LRLTYNYQHSGKTGESGGRHKGGDKPIILIPLGGILFAQVLWYANLEAVGADDCSEKRDGLFTRATVTSMGLAYDSRMVGDSDTVCGDSCRGMLPGVWYIVRSPVANLPEGSSSTHVDGTFIAFQPAPWLNVAALCSGGRPNAKFWLTGAVEEGMFKMATKQPFFQPDHGFGTLNLERCNTKAFRWSRNYPLTRCWHQDALYDLNHRMIPACSVSRSPSVGQNFQHEVA
jgi:hypothetical protein